MREMRYPWDEDGTLPIFRFAVCPPCPTGQCPEMYFSPVSGRWECVHGSAARIGDQLVYTEGNHA